MNEEDSLWRQVIRSILGKEPFNWHMVGNSGYSLKSPWISIFRVWRKVDTLASFGLGDGTRIGFWTDGWIDNLPLCTQYPQLFRITLLSKGFITAHWDNSISLIFRNSGRLLNDNEILAFQNLKSLRSNLSQDTSRLPLLWTRTYIKLCGKSKHSHLGYDLWSLKLRFNHAKEVTKQLLITFNMPTV